MLTTLVLFLGLGGGLQAAAEVAPEHAPWPRAQGRKEIPLNDGWSFVGSNIALEEVRETVSLPHTWNALDAQAGYDFYQGKGTYEKTLLFDETYRDKRVFVHFGAVGTVADVSMNGQPLGQHRGGYSAFAFEFTRHLRIGEPHMLVVVADNSPADDVIPLAGDFDQFGGMHRPAKLIITEKANITPLDHASPGVYLTQRAVDAERAEVDVRAEVSNGYSERRSFGLRITVLDDEGRVVARARGEAGIEAGGTAPIEASVVIDQPRLWNGLADPYLYRALVELRDGEQVIDRVEQPLGLRSFRVDPDEGFFLNGAPLPLRGIARHNERKDRGSALRREDHDEDLALILELGANAVRLAHYQHPQYFYDLADRAGLVVWAEIPFVGVPTFLGATYRNDPAFHANVRQQLTELIRQNYNHPSILFWGLFNEQPNPDDNSPVPFLEELQALAEEEDSTRVTTAASMVDPSDPIHDVSHTIAWNRYAGWYYGQPEELAEFLDDTHEQWPERSIGVSEYGAGASIVQHEEAVAKPNPVGLWHPEGWQSYFHEESYRAIAQRPFVWASFVWSMFDFTASARREGDAPGINDKGLVTHDRQTRKDAFFFYKATWSDEPVLHITGRRHFERGDDEIDIKVYSNLPTVELVVNGEAQGPGERDGVVFRWREVPLQRGNNVVRATAGELADAVVWMRSGPAMALVRAAAKVTAHLGLVVIVAGGLMAACFWQGRWRASSRAARWVWSGLAWLLVAVNALLWAGIAYLAWAGFNPFDP